MFEDDRAYYQRRAEFEAERARSATVPKVIQAHRSLAKAYRGKLSYSEAVKVEPS